MKLESSFVCYSSKNGACIPNWLLFSSCLAILYSLLAIFPFLIGPVMLCHKRTEKVVKVFFDVILEQLPALKLYMKAIGADEEKSLIHVACVSFSTTALLLFLLHAKKNIKRS